MNCTNCGTPLPQGTAFCPGCGAATCPPDGRAAPVSGPAQWNAFDDETVSLGDWVLTLFLATIPLVGFILLLVWGFSAGTNPSKRNYARAALIWNVVWTILMILAGGAILGVVASLLQIFSK